MNSRIHGMIRPATDHDMELIGRWLQEASRSGVDSLWPNWRLTQKVHAKEKGVRVFVESETGEPVAYCWGSLNTSDSILDVRPSHRGRGGGSIFVEHLIEESRSLEEPLCMSLVRLNRQSSSGTRWDSVPNVLTALSKLRV